MNNDKIVISINGTSPTPIEFPNYIYSITRSNQAIEPKIENINIRRMLHY